MEVSTKPVERALSEILNGQRLFFSLLLRRVGIDAAAFAKDLELAADITVAQHGDQKIAEQHFDVTLLRLLAADLRPPANPKRWRPTVVPMDEL